jgi:galactokinase
MKNIIRDQFYHLFRQNPETYIFAPGRANIIGEHTDYNHGYVLPFALGQGMWFAFSDNGTSLFQVYAYNQNDLFSFHSHSLPEHETGWKKFIIQVLKVMGIDDSKGMNMVFGGNLPLGAGISSSSALTCGWVTALMIHRSVKPEADKIIDFAVQAERGYGVQGGIMDQFTIVNARKDTTILLDCRNNTPEYISLPSHDWHFFLINTHIKHNLVDTEYNIRRSECKEAVRILHQNHPHIHSLRDATISDIEILKSLPVLYRRALFVVSENDRVLSAVSAIKSQDRIRLGKLMYESHEGLRDLYQVSCAELDHLVDYSLSIPQILGSRMMGGGFGGCTLNLTDGPLQDDIIYDIKKSFRLTFGTDPDIIPVTPENGIVHPIMTEESPRHN